MSMEPEANWRNQAKARAWSIVVPFRADTRHSTSLWGLLRASFPYFEELNLGLCDLSGIRVSEFPINF
jgi:hypothetical protein